MIPDINEAARMKRLVQKSREDVSNAKARLQLHVEIAHHRGASWADIGSWLGISRQAAWERFGKKPGLPAPEDVCQQCGTDLSPDGTCGWCG
jgi:hypothetical protein